MFEKQIMILRISPDWGIGETLNGCSWDGREGCLWLNYKKYLNFVKEQNTGYNDFKFVCFDKSLKETNS
jgi:hypothetical protein